MPKLTAGLNLDYDDRSLLSGFKNFRSANVIATKNTLNVAAAITRRNALVNIKQDFTLRNSWTARNIQFQKVQSNDINKMQSSVGATTKISYMETQEIGGKRRNLTSKTVSYPQDESRESKSAAKPVSKSLYLSRIKNKFVKGTFRNAKTEKAKIVAMMFMAKKKNLFMRKNNFITKVNNISSRNGKVRFSKTDYYSMTNKSIMIKKNPWLYPAMIKPASQMYEIYKSQLKKLWITGKVI